MWCLQWRKIFWGGNFGGGGTIMTLEIIVDASDQTKDPQREVVLVEEAQTILMVVAMDLVVEVVDVVAEGFENSRKRLQFLAGESEELPGICRLL